MKWAQIASGLLVFSFGVHLTIFANIGPAPWDCLGMGIAKYTLLNYGASMTAMAVIIPGIDLLLKERIGNGTVVSTFGAGPVMRAVYSILYFEPRTAQHRDVIAVLRELQRQR